MKDTSQANPFDTPIYYVMNWLPNADMFLITQNVLPNKKLQIQLWQQGHTSGPVKMLIFPKGHSPHHKAVNDIAWSPDGKYIADCSGDNTAIIWKVDAE